MRPSGAEAASVRLSPGERHTVRLPGRGAAGYAWVARVDGDPDVVDVSMVARPGADRPPGAGVDRVVTVEGRRPGRVTVYLEQRRSWERQGQPADRRVLDVTVG